MKYVDALPKILNGGRWYHTNKDKIVPEKDGTKYIIFHADKLINDKGEIYHLTNDEMFKVDTWELYEEPFEITETGEI